MRFAAVVRRVRALLAWRHLDEEIEEEFADHLERQAQANIARGMSPDAARAAALRTFGGLTQRREECREARGLALVDTTSQDIRYALRTLARSPGFTAVAVLSLTLGIGANATIFAFVNAVLLRPLPYPDPDRLVVLREQKLGESGTVLVHPQNFLEWKARAQSFDALTLVQTIPANVLAPDGAEQVTESQATPELFRVFGIAPRLGRMFSREEAAPGHPTQVALLGYDYWVRRFGARSDIIGHTVETPDGAVTLIGVAPQGLRIGTVEPDLIVPLPIDPARPDAIGSRSFACFGRLRPETSIASARAEMEVIASALARRYPLDRGYGVFVASLQEYLVTESRPALRLLMAVVAMVLVIACVNLAGLLLARGIARRSELAVRASLGATRSRLVRQLTVESLALAAIGGGSGLALAYWSTRALVALVPGALTTGAEPIRLDVTTVLFTVVLSIVTALAFGVLPAWQASRLEPWAVAGRTRGATADRRHHRTRSALVVAQVALAVVLLVGAGLLLESFAGLAHVDPGFSPARTMTFRVFLGDRPASERVALLERLLDRLRALPGVVSAGSIQFLPLAGMTCGTGVWFEGQVPGDPAQAASTDCSLVSPGFFEALRIPMLEGRAFTAHDRSDSPRVVVVNRAFARRYFPGRSALGQRILLAGPAGAWAEIVGVAGDIRHEGLAIAPVPAVFQLHAQAPGYITSLVVRTDEPNGGPDLPSIERAIHEVDRTQAISGARTMEQYVDDGLVRPRLYGGLVAVFAGLSATLALIGIYGLLAYVVGQRTHEIGIRLALGERRRSVFERVISHALLLIGCGLAIGIVTALAARGVIAAFLYGVTATDSATYAAAAGLFLLLCLIVSALPAWRASTVDAMAALRYE